MYRFVERDINVFAPVTHQSQVQVASPSGEYRIPSFHYLDELTVAISRFTGGAFLFPLPGDFSIWLFCFQLLIAQRFS
ncbi:uncharacterized protein BO95DRAFT_202479 [Aspergillus brunneoviolaceus CBS 621.78]|uniref:Uncharacterized protein n=1 Tax=Aspergillus brunneoviolaceus CBS 621.78 TaxID=1450534 RepID=A0ACD1G3B2_9EURO|nr:hypothetical protein BO95DRAFT_202479 [Aspergillus brunneoviolaceus CBS 621.78]RAH43716.1 hypothetical protein BO95DRAFT_202479 [Aspergillus brunneoviolaceus CBS 621.78]